MAIVLDGTAGITTPDLTDTSLTSGRVVYAGASGNLTGSDNLTFSGTSLTLKTGYYEAYDPVDSTSAGVGMRFYTDGGGTKTENGRLTVAQTATSGSLSSMIFQTNNGTSLAEKMRITGAGNVGIGTSSPNNNLEVYGTTNPTIGLTTTSSTLYCYYGMTAGTVGGTLFTFGQSYSAVYPAGSTALANNTYGVILNASNATGILRFQTADTERARIDSSGNFIVLAAGSGSLGKITTRSDGGIPLAVSNESSSGTLVSFQGNGSGQVGSITHNGAATAYNTSSDYRLKNTISPMTGALAKVALLKPVTYKWNSNGSDGQGFIAHELAEVCPQAVTGAKDAVDSDGKPVHQGVDTSFLVATLTAAIQEQQALITTLTERITALEGA